MYTYYLYYIYTPITRNFFNLSIIFKRVKKIDEDPCLKRKNRTENVYIQI